MIVTGASGFIGRRMVSMLERQGLAPQTWTRAQLELRSAKQVSDKLAGQPPRAVFHLASSGVSATAAHKGSIIANDVAMVENLVSALSPGSTLIISGSMSEYGSAGQLREDVRCMPRTAYGIAKLAAAHFALAYGPSRGITVRIARLFGVYGPGEASARLFQTVLAGLKRNERIALSDGLQKRDFIHVDDVCKALLDIARLPKDAPSVINVGTGKAVRVRDVVTWMAEAAERPASLLDFGARPRSPGDEDLLEADTTLFSQWVGKAPPQRLRQGLSLSLFEH